MFTGQGGDQTINYIMTLMKMAQKEEAKKMEKEKEISANRQKGKPPYSEHPSLTGQPLPKRPRTDEHDPTYIPEIEPKKAGRGRGAIKGRGRGERGRGSRGRGVSARGRGRGGNSSCNTSFIPNYKMKLVNTTPPVKSEHWRPIQLEALVNACNHLKPVLKGRFKHYTDGVELKELAWEEVAGKDICNIFPFLASF